MVDGRDWAQLKLIELLRPEFLSMTKSFPETWKMIISEKFLIELCLKLWNFKFEDLSVKGKLKKNLKRNVTWFNPCRLLCNFSPAEIFARGKN